MPPQQYFDTEVHKDTRTKKKWAAIPSDRRALISDNFFEILLGPRMREHVRPVRSIVLPSGKKLILYVMRLHFGMMVFGFLPLKRDGELALIDFFIDETLLAVAMRSPHTMH